MKESRVDILDAATGEIINHCHGPAPGGRCPVAGKNGTVLCNGCRIAPMGAEPVYWHMLVPAGSRQCPQAWNLEVIGY